MWNFSQPFGGDKNHQVLFCFTWLYSLSSESVEGTSLALECVNDVKGRHCLAASVLSVSDCVADDVLQENL